MKGDFSRFYFDPRKNYAGTLMQQGRVQLDADWNEQQAIHRYRHETAIADVIGPHGAPNEGGGFAIGIAQGGKDLSISTGCMYVEGLRVDNLAAQPVLLSNQPFLQRATETLAGFTFPQQSGRYLAYLDVWERHVTAIEDPQIRETALGGPDTTTRTQIVWQVRLSPQPVGNSTCADFGPGWSPAGLITNGNMCAKTSDSDTSGPCILPPVAGYRGLENQLYRVEIHRSGIRDNPDNRPTIKWSRDNGSVITVVKASGQVLTARDLGRDEVLGFAANQWVELIDQRMELADKHGQLLQIESINPTTREIKIKEATKVPFVDTSGPVRLCRWDNTGTDATDSGIVMTTAPLKLENGIEVQFSGGHYQSGDYWMIPARTAINSETGFIEWPQDSNGNPLFKSPDGIVHHYCPLALVDFNAAATTFSAVPDADCRRFFPELTAIRARDVKFDNSSCHMNSVETVQEAIEFLCENHMGSCTLVPSPGPGWEKVFDTVVDGHSAKVCFPAGEFFLEKPLIIKNKGNMTINGAGNGTKIISRNSEIAILFQGCGQIVVRDLSGKSEKAGTPTTGQGFEHLNGVFTFVDCESVVLEGVESHCAGGSERAASCITVCSAPDKVPATVSVRHCGFFAGNRQIGILLVNPVRATIEDNAVQCIGTVKDPLLPELLQNERYFSQILKRLVSNFYIGNQPPVKSPVNASVMYKGITVHYKTEKSLAAAWQALLDAVPPPDAHNRKELAKYFQKLAARAIRDPSFRARFPALRMGFERVFKGEPAVGTKGIVVGGGGNQKTAPKDIRLINNSVSGFQQGIHIGVSHGASNSDPNKTDRVGRVLVAGNTLEILLSSIVRRERHGIFVGNCDSLVVENNYVKVVKLLNLEDKLAIDGVRVYGYLGPFAIIRQNHLENVDVGILINPLNTPAGKPQWLVSDNVMPRASVDVKAPATVIKRDNFR